VALAVTRQGSHRSGRARISASGSSDRQIRHPRMVPEAIRSTYVDMLENLDVFNMFPSIESADRRFAFLHRVLQGEFPCFNGTIKALRRPAAIPPHFVSFAWRYLGCTRCFRSRADECAAEAWSWSPGISSRELAEERTGFSQVPGESQLSVCT